MSKALLCRHCGEAFELHEAGTAKCPSKDVFRDTTYEQSGWEVANIKFDTSTPFYRADSFQLAPDAYKCDFRIGFHKHITAGEMIDLLQKVDADAILAYDGRIEMDFNRPSVAGSNPAPSEV